jgi:regulatory protein
MTRPDSTIDDPAGWQDDEKPGRLSNPVEVRNKALDYLARREYGMQELCAKLMDAGFEEQTAIAVVKQLTRDGLQDDRRFVESFIQSRIHQGKGPVRIRMELEQRGIDSATVAEMLEEMQEVWTSLACGVRQKKFGTEPPQGFREKARQMRFLQYRGFDSAQIQAAVASRDED